MSSEKRQALILETGHWIRRIWIFLDSGGREKMTLPVQFNPNDYTITRELEYRSTNGIGQEVHPFHMQPIRGQLAKLSVTIFIDSSTELQEFVMPKNLKNMSMRKQS